MSRENIQNENSSDKKLEDKNNRNEKKVIEIKNLTKRYKK